MWILLILKSVMLDLMNSTQAQITLLISNIKCKVHNVGRISQLSAFLTLTLFTLIQIIT